MRPIVAIILTLFVYLLNSCTVYKNTMKENVVNSYFPSFSYEGHRGARGLYPENSIGAMKTSIDLPKVTTLELDCHITKDKKVVVYHDDYLNPKFVTYTNGRELAKKDREQPIYNFNLSELSKFDTGIKNYQDFPKQIKKPTSIPLLADLIEESEAYAAEKRMSPMFYNIETKSDENNDHKAHPAPQEFVDLIIEVIIDKNIVPRTIIQSFDKRTIQYVNKTYPQIKTSYLIDLENKKTIRELVEELGFTPFIISPNYKLVTVEFVKEAHALGIKVIPWTVNTKADIEQLKQLKVDGIISDFPDLF